MVPRLVLLRSVVSTGSVVGRSSQVVAVSRLLSQCINNKKNQPMSNHMLGSLRHSHTAADLPPPPPPVDDASYFARAKLCPEIQKYAIPFPQNHFHYEDFIIGSADFAVSFHNQNQNAQLQFVRILKADYIQVGGKLLFITLEVNDAGKSDFYRTVVYYRSWEKKRFVRVWERVEAPTSPSATKY